jgi:hypothetical protein
MIGSGSISPDCSFPVGLISQQGAGVSNSSPGDERFYAYLSVVFVLDCLPRPSFLTSLNGNYRGGTLLS